MAANDGNGGGDPAKVRAFEEAFWQLCVKHSMAPTIKRLETFSPTGELSTTYGLSFGPVDPEVLERLRAPREKEREFIVGHG